MPRDRDRTRALLPLHLAALSYAMDMEGAREDYVNGRWTNWGPEIKQFLYAAGIDSPAPWCAAFVNWCAEEAAYDKNMVSILEDVPLQAYVPSYVEWAELNDRIIDANEAGPGDLFALYYPSMERYAHIGFVIEVHEDDGWFETIEGNTNDEAAREGYEVAKRSRNLTENVCFIRWD